MQPTTAALPSGPWARIDLSGKRNDVIAEFLDDPYLLKRLLVIAVTNGRLQAQG